MMDLVFDTASVGRDDFEPKLRIESLTDTRPEPLRPIIYEIIKGRMGGRAVALDDATSFGPDGLDFDSIDFLDLLMDVEHRSGLRLRDETLGEDAFTTIGGLLRYVGSLQSD